MPNSIDFYKRIFLHVVPSRIIVPCSDGHGNKKHRCFLSFFFCLIGIHSCKAEQPLQGMELQEKEVQKD